VVLKLKIFESFFEFAKKFVFTGIWVRLVVSHGVALIGLVV